MKNRLAKAKTKGSDDQLKEGIKEPRCANCSGDPKKHPLVTEVLCERCRQNVLGAAERRRERLRGEGLCIFCGGRKAQETSDLCEPCQERNTANQEARRAALVASPLCVKCQLRPKVTTLNTSPEGAVPLHCQQCADAFNKKNEAAWKKAVAKRKENGQIQPETPAWALPLAPARSPERREHIRKLRKLGWKYRQIAAAYGNTFTPEAARLACL